MTIVLPLPPKVLHPNGRTRNHLYRAQAVKKYRGEAALVASHAPDRPATPWARAKVQPTFYLKRRQDGDNLNASIKSALDGLQGIAYANDSGVTLLPARQITGKGLSYRVELEITEDRGDA